MDGFVDEDLVQAKQALKLSSLHAIRKLQVERLDGALVISGSVASFYHKQMAQEAIRAVCREAELHNSVYVE